MQEPLKGVSVNLAFVLLDTEQASVYDTASSSTGATLSNIETLDCVSSFGCLDQKFDQTMGSLCMCVFETRMETGSELFSVLTCTQPHSHCLVSFLHYKNMGDNMVLALEMFSSGCHPRFENACA